LCRKASQVPARLSLGAIHNAGKTMHDYAVSQPNRIRVLFATASQYLSLFILSPSPSPGSASLPLSQVPFLSTIKGKKVERGILPSSGLIPFISHDGPLSVCINADAEIAAKGIRCEIDRRYRGLAD